MEWRLADMKFITNSSGIIRIIAGWMVFLFGWGVLFWLHRLRDNLAHQAILPLFLLFWIGQLALVWDGCKTTALRWRYGLFTVQAVASVVLSARLFEYLIGQSP